MTDIVAQIASAPTPRANSPSAYGEDQNDNESFGSTLSDRLEAIDAKSAKQVPAKPDRAERPPTAESNAASPKNTQSPNSSAPSAPQASKSTDQSDLPQTAESESESSEAADTDVTLVPDTNPALAVTAPTDIAAVIPAKTPLVVQAQASAAAAANLQAAEAALASGRIGDTPAVSANTQSPAGDSAPTEASALVEAASADTPGAANALKLLEALGAKAQRASHGSALTLPAQATPPLAEPPEPASTRPQQKLAQAAIDTAKAVMGKLTADIASVSAGASHSPTPHDANASDAEKPALVIQSATPAPSNAKAELPTPAPALGTSATPSPQTAETATVSNNVPRPDVAPTAPAPSTVFASTLTGIAAPAQPASLASLATLRAQMNGPRLAIPAEQIALAIRRHQSAGMDRFDIRLDPPELGRIEVRIELSSDGTTKAHLSAERQETLDMLTRDARALERSLNGLGLKTDRDALAFSLTDQRSAGRQGGEQRDGSGRAGPAGSANDEIEIVTEVTARIVDPSRIDILI